MSPHARLRVFVQQSGVYVKEIADAIGISRAYLYLLMDEQAGLAPGRLVAAAIEDMTGIERSAWDSGPLPASAYP